MKTKEEIQERIDVLYARVQKAEPYPQKYGLWEEVLGEETARAYQSRIRREIRSLQWVLSEEVHLIVE